MEQCSRAYISKFVEDCVLDFTIFDMVNIFVKSKLFLRHIFNLKFFFRIIMPLMQSYTQAGEFTIRGKLKSALVDNAIYYGSYLFIAGILLIYIAVKPGLELDW